MIRAGNAPGASVALDAAADRAAALAYERGLASPSSESPAAGGGGGGGARIAS